MRAWAIIVLIIKKTDLRNEVADVLQGVEGPNVEFLKRKVEVYSDHFEFLTRTQARPKGETPDSLLIT